MKIHPVFFVLLLITGNLFAADKVLVSIGKDGQITEQQLEAAMLAAPFATQFPAMDEQDQAYLRGDMLLRLARAEALYQEAIAAEVHQSTVFQQEMGNYQTALLAQRYLDYLRQQIVIPKEKEQQFNDKFADNNDALIAAKSAYVAQQFNVLKQNSIQQLIEQAAVRVYSDRMANSPTSTTILAEGNDGLQIRYADLIAGNPATDYDRQRTEDKVNEWVQLWLMANAAANNGINIDKEMQLYSRNLAISLLLVEQEKTWIPDEQALSDYFQQHPDIGYVPERRQIGQIVLGSEQEAEAMRSRIIGGESLFELAAQFSIDPYGKQRSGDMGWLKEGSASKEIEDKIADLADNEISPVIKTDKGWHLITIVNRKPAEHKDYAAIKDRVKQQLIAEKMSEYLDEVTTRHPLTWHIADSTTPELNRSNHE
jgi:parvulin-like peptidyl-prolyl isomerase